jgi:tetratricopeptide (TPR) repeat protein
MKASRDAKQSGDASEAANALCLETFVLAELGKIELALEVVSDAIEHATKANDEVALLFAYREQSWLLNESKQFSSALGPNHLGMDLATKFGDAAAQATLLRQAAFSHLKLMNYEEALRFATQATEMATRAELETENAAAQGIAAIAYAKLLRNSDALEAWAQTLKLACPTGQRCPEWVTQLQSTLLESFAETLSDIGASHAWMRALDASSLTRTNEVAAHTMVMQVAYRWVRGITDPDRLGALLNALQINLASRYEDIERLLAAYRDYHAALRDPVVLSRVDPDLAQTILAMYPPNPHHAAQAAAGAFDFVELNAAQREA